MSNSIHTYKDLIVWQKSVEMSILVYRISEGFPKSETFGLSLQMRRSAVSVASNIAEGNGRRKEGNEYRQFLYISRGSLQELETQIIIAEKLGFIKKTELLEKILLLLREVEKMLNTILSKLK